MKKTYITTTKVTHKQLRKTLIWETAMKVSILLKDMTDNHLINTILYLRKKIAELVEHNLPITTINSKKLNEWEDILEGELIYRKLA
tara:strand:- start:1747 stop:2007 length:261 start_codon:yes stop_codon:yes gene_type:complete